MPVTRTNSTPVEYPYWWFSRITVVADNPNADADVYIDAIPFRVKDDGLRELQYPPTIFQSLPPGQTCDAKQLTVKELFATSDFDQTKLAALQAVLADATPAQKMALAQIALYAAIEAVGKEKGEL